MMNHALEYESCILNNNMQKKISIFFNNLGVMHSDNKLKDM
jgi:hypothetical protein